MEVLPVTLFHQKVKYGIAPLLFSQLFFSRLIGYHLR